jgi:hypothetical protein
MYDVVKYIVVCIASLSLYLSQPKQANKSLKNPPGYHMYKINKKKGKKKQKFRGRKAKVLGKVFDGKAHAKMLCWMKMQEVYVVG